MREWVLSSSLLILVVAALRYALRGKIPLRLQYALWSLVLLRLLLPGSVGKSALSLENYIPERPLYSETLPTADPVRAGTEPTSRSDLHYAPAAEISRPADAYPTADIPAEPVPAPAEPAGGRMAWGGVLRAVWLSGAAVLLLITGASNIVFSLRLRRGRRAEDCPGFPLPVYSSCVVDSPCLVGFFRPAVYISPELLNSGDGLRHVLIHELSHYRHLDHIWSRLRCLALALHWYNPLAWLAAALSRRDAELACDEAAIAKLGEAERAGYGRTLIGLACPGRPRVLNIATTMADSRHGIKERIKLLAEKPRTAAMALIIVLFVALTAAGCAFTGKNGGTEAGEIADAENADQNQSAAAGRPEYSEENALEEIVYTIPEGDTAGPKPDASKFGSTTDPNEIQALITSAAALLNGQTLSFDPNADFFPDSNIKYYCDDSILVIAWKEIIDGKCVSCAEVKIAHGSQLRRKLADDCYDSRVLLKASTMASDTNSVVAINGDFYAFRDLGIISYQRQLYRCNPAAVDSCHFTASGDMLFSYAGELMEESTAQQFIDDNNVVFSIAFGPVLVDNGELRHIDSYPLGEIDKTYSRASIGLLDERHYLLMTINYEGGCTVTSTINQSAQFMYDKGCRKAYALDGGQAAVMVMQGQTVNNVDWGTEREMSDILYFATAIPEESSE